MDFGHGPTSQLKATVRDLDSTLRPMESSASVPGLCKLRFPDMHLFLHSALKGKFSTMCAFLQLGALCWLAVISPLTVPGCTLAMGILQWASPGTAVPQAEERDPSICWHPGQENASARKISSHPAFLKQQWDSSDYEGRIKVAQWKPSLCLCNFAYTAGSSLSLSRGTHCISLCRMETTWSKMLLCALHTIYEEISKHS